MNIVHGYNKNIIHGNNLSIQITSILIEAIYIDFRAKFALISRRHIALRILRDLQETRFQHLFL